MFDMKTMWNTWWAWDDGRVTSQSLCQKRDTKKRDETLEWYMREGVLALFSAPDAGKARWKVLS